MTGHSGVAPRLTRLFAGTPLYSPCTRHHLTPGPCGPFVSAPQLPPALHLQQPPKSAGCSTADRATASNAATAMSATCATPHPTHSTLAPTAHPTNAPIAAHRPWTPVHLDRLKVSLRRHPDQDFVQSLLHDMRYGAVIGYTGDRSHLITPNLPSATLSPASVSEYLRAECAAGRMAGPYTYLPFAHLRCSGVGLVPKKSGKLRLIMHLSAPAGRSINDGISTDDYSLHYVTIDDAVKLMHKYGPGALLAKVDLRNAFRLCPVAPSDWPLLGIRWGGQFYVDKCLPFGLRSSPYLFNRLADALCWVACNKFGVKDLIHYLDDYLLVQPAQPLVSGRQQFYTLLATMEFLHVPLAEGADKVCPPCTTLTFLGIELDSDAWEMRLPLAKLTEIKELLARWIHRTRCTKRELLSLAGSLSFAAKVVSPGRTFCRRLFDAASSLELMDKAGPIDPDAMDDITWWHACIEAWNGKTILTDPVWQKPADTQLYVDASDFGYGIVHGTTWALGKWLPEHQALSIEWRELFPIALVCTVLGRRLANQRLLLHCDNEAVCTIWKTGTSKAPNIMCLLRVALLAAAKHNLTVLVTHIRGTDNSLADALSRSQVDKFKSMLPHAEREPLPVDPQMVIALTRAPWASSLQEWRRLRPKHAERE